MFVDFFKKFWNILNKISPTNRNLIIVLLMGYIFYSLINLSTLQFLRNHIFQQEQSEKKAELYAKDTAIDINRHVRLIAYKDEAASNVLLLGYHNSKQSLLGYRYLYLSCLTESAKKIDAPLLKSLWNNLEYMYYADELEKLHNTSLITFNDIEDMKVGLPKLYLLVKSSNAKSVTFCIVEGKDGPIGILVIFYSDIPLNTNYLKTILPSILKIAILLDYENVNNDE